MHVLDPGTEQFKAGLHAAVDDIRFIGVPAHPNPLVFSGFHDGSRNRWILSLPPVNLHPDLYAAARPIVAKLPQALADSRASGKVPHVREPSKRRPVRRPLQELRDPGQTGSEREGLDPAEDILERIKKLKKEARVKVHGP